MFNEFHFDGSERIYLKHEIKPEDRVNQYIEIPDNIQGVVKIFPLQGLALTGGDMFDIRYQIAMNDLYNLTTVSMVPYMMTMTHLNLLNEVLVGQVPVRFSRRAGKLWLDMDWSKVTDGHFIVIEAHQLIDPEEFSNTWNDIWLKRYATSLIKEQWGANLSKFTNMQLPNGLTLNGTEIYNQAKREREQLEEELKDTYMEMPLDRMG